MNTPPSENEDHPISSNTSPTNNHSRVGSIYQHTRILPAAALEMHQNFSSFITQARTQFERQAERTRTIGSSLNSVFQEVHRVNSFRTWMPAAQVASSTPSNEEPSSTEAEPTDIADSNRHRAHIDSVAINIFPNDINAQPQMQQQPPRNESSGVEEDAIVPLLTSHQERIASIIRDEPSDPPDFPDAAGSGAPPDTDVFSQFPAETRRSFSNIMRYLPFVCIVVLKSAYDYGQVLLDLTSLSWVFWHTNCHLKAQISRQTQRSIWILQRGLLLIITVVAFRAVTKRTDYFMFILFLDRTSSFSVNTFGYLVLSLTITDLVAKLVTVAAKTAVTLLPPTVVNFKRRGRIYFLIESISQLYRSLVPIQLWLEYLLDTYHGMEKIFAVILSTAYFVSKAFDLLAQIKFCRRAVIAFLRKLNHGIIPTKDQLATSGGLCPICHETFDNPAALQCGHVFCEMCVGTWFSREQTCPMCRAKVAEDLSWQDGSTSLLLQLF